MVGNQWMCGWNCNWEN